MSKWTTGTLGVLALGVCLIVVWGVALTGLANPLSLPDGQSRPLRAGTNEAGLRAVTPDGAQDTRDGVTLRVVEASFSSSESRLLVEVTGLPAEVSFQDFSRNTALDVDGFVGGRDVLRPEGAASSAEGNPRAWLVLGPAVDVEKPVTISLTWDDDSPQSAFTAGAVWQVGFVPGPSAKDPVDVFTELDHNIEYGPLTIKVKGAHISSSQVSLYYDMIMEPGVTADPVQEVAKLVYGDKQEVEGAETARFSETQADGSLKVRSVDPLTNAPYAVTFPMVREPEESFTVEFGGFLVGVPGERDYTLPADGAAGVVQMGDNTFGLTATRDGDGNIVIRSQRTSGTDPGGFIVGSPGKTMLWDDLGQRHALLRAETGFRKTETTEPAADRTILVFAGPLDPAARLLHLTVSDSAQVLSPSGDTQLTLSSQER